MQRYDFAKPARAALMDELIAGVPGFDPATMEVGLTPLGSFVVCPPALAGAVAAVVAAHDVAALDAADMQAQTRRRQARQAIVGYPDLAAPSNAQTVAAVKALCLAVAELYRTT